MKRLNNRLDSTPSEGALTDWHARKALCGDEKVGSAFGYKPSYELCKGIHITIQWMLLHRLRTELGRIQCRDSLPGSNAVSGMVLS
jgi:hypothetical protein